MRYSVAGVGDRGGGREGRDRAGGVDTRPLCALPVPSGLLPRRTAVHAFSTATAMAGAATLLDVGAMPRFGAHRCGQGCCRRLLLLAPPCAHGNTSRSRRRRLPSGAVQRGCCDARELGVLWRSRRSDAGASIRIPISGRAHRRRSHREGRCGRPFVGRHRHTAPCAAHRTATASHAVGCSAFVVQPRPRRAVGLQLRVGAPANVQEHLARSDRFSRTDCEV